MSSESIISKLFPNSFYYKLKKKSSNSDFILFWSGINLEVHITASTKIQKTTKLLEIKCMSNLIMSHKQIQ